MTMNKDFLIARLRELDSRLGDRQQAEIVVRPNDDFDWTSLETCESCALPGHQHGQERDMRYATDGAEGLHARVFADRTTFHLDRVDACRDLPGHGAQDTMMLGGAAIGALLGALCSSASWGALIGGAIGATMPSRATTTVEFRTLAAHFPYSHDTLGVSHHVENQQASAGYSGPSFWSVP